MLKETDIYEDQALAIDRLYNHDHTFLIAPMGAGKTLCALNAAKDLLADGVIKRVLVFAGQKVCNNVWRGEHQEWEHLQHMNIGIATGNEAQRTKVLHSDADVVVMTFNQIPWLFACDWRWQQFDGLVVDELSKFAANKKQGSWLKTIRYNIPHFKWRVGMTGTPVAEALTALFGQMLIIDGGKALGQNKDKFLRKYFYPTDHAQRNWSILPDGSAEKLVKKIASVMHVMPDYTHTLPACVIHPPTKVPMDEHTAIMYKLMVKDMVVEVDGELVVAQNAAVKSGKLEQIAQGFLYQGDGANQTRVRVHHTKTDELVSMVQLSLEWDHNVIVVYQFKEDYAELRKTFPNAPSLSGQESAAEVEETIRMWNEGKVPVLLLQPQSAGHGLNLAKGGHEMIFYTPLWSNDFTKQTIARLWRRGQTSQVNVWTICLEGSIDLIKLDRVEYKETHHPLLLSHLKAVIQDM